MNVPMLDFHAPDASEAFVESLRTTGFALLRNHPLDNDLLQRIYRDWLEFFQSAVKEEFLFDAESDDGVQAGYVPSEVSETAVGQHDKDLKEFFNFAPDGFFPASLRKDIRTYRKAAFSLGLELVSWIDQHLPDNVASHIRPLPDILGDETSLLRVIHYPPLGADAPPKAVRAAAHEDINIITVLPVSEQPGLQVKSVDGEWLDLAGQPGALAVNTGDMLQEATDFYFPSTTHRVVNPAGSQGNTSRISIPYFLHCRRDVVLSDRYTAGSYLAERLALLNPELKPS